MNMNKNQLNGLLNLASKKLGTTPETLQKQLESGQFDKALAGMNSTDSKRLKEALSNPKVAEKILSTPQAQEIYKKLTK